MKYVITLFAGLLVGAALFAIGVVYNPFHGKQDLSPLAVTDAPTITLTYPGVASESIAYTNDGESRIQPHPDKVLQLWEQAIRQTSAMATVLRDGRNQTAGIGIKISSAAEETHLLSGHALMNSIWYVYLPGRGGFFIEESENYWDYLREVVVPGYRSPGNTWAGTWLGNMTAGPGALGTAKVTGGTGEFEGLDMLGVESLSVRAWKVESGAVAAEGRLLIELPTDPLGEATALEF